MSIKKKGLIIPNTPQDDMLEPWEEIIENGKIIDDYIEIILSMENGQKITGFAYELDWRNFQLEPENFRKVIVVLSHIDAFAILQYDEKKNETFIVLDLDEKQEQKLNKLKSLCK